MVGISIMASDLKFDWRLLEFKDFDFPNLLQTSKRKGQLTLDVPWPMLELMSSFHREAFSKDSVTIWLQLVRASAIIALIETKWQVQRNQSHAQSAQYQMSVKLFKDRHGICMHMWAAHRLAKSRGLETKLANPCHLQGREHSVAAMAWSRRVM